jgi:hypothetical protein
MFSRSSSQLTKKINRREKRELPLPVIIFGLKKGLVGYRLVEICKVFHKKNKHVKCNEFGPVSMKIIRFA